MGWLVLFSVVTLVTLSSSYGENKFAGLMDLSDRVFIDGFGFCGVICVAPNLHQHVNKTLYQCQNSVMEITNETRQLAIQQGRSVHNPEDFYNFAVKRQGSSKSRLCRWSQSVLDGCVGQLVNNQCDHDGIKREMTRITKEAEAYVCSLDPAVMECAMHPEVMKDAHLCAAPLTAKFGKYFNTSVPSEEEHLKQFQRFYNGEIKTNNAESLYSAFKTLGTCVSTLIGQSSVQGTNCSTVKDLLDAEIDNVIAYFKKTDMLKCNFDPELWRHLKECGQTFGKAIEERVATPDPRVFSDPTFDPRAHYVDIFKRFAKDDYQLLKDPLKAFTTCTLRSFKDVCGEKWTYNLAHTKLTLLENLFNPKDKTVPEHCEAIIQKQRSSAGTSKTVVVAHVAAAVLLRVLIML